MAPNTFTRAKGFVAILKGVTRLYIEDLYSISEGCLGLAGEKG